MSTSDNQGKKSRYCSAAWPGLGEGSHPPVSEVRHPLFITVVALPCSVSYPGLFMKGLKI